MLGKLLKYEIPAVGRKLGPMYLAWLAASVLLGLTVGRFDGSNGFMIIPPLVYFGVTVAVFVMAIILIIERYSNSLLGDEAYFNQVLPVSAGEHILSKTITALIWTVLTMLAAIVSGILIGLLAGGAEMIWAGEPVEMFDLWGVLSQIKISGDVVLLVIEFLITAVFSTVKSILAVYTAITIGHQFRNHVIPACIAAYVGVMVFEASVGNILISIGAFVTGDIDFAKSFGSGVAATQIILGISFIVTLVLIAIYFFICKYFMEKKLNLQ